eukprot:CAMPEP_0174738710 /NCGR_PEP_ID=MMETSP1094-20130205/70393_1 /TAXON_ID=156173 /ORGANISM="Chrysochromulina brevifilum, Strain UTEX LB 985" /LENGTH=168 /DNA_ID=CAMNT_0015942177 /DNA_START=303 /DNA_END=810 /DNA_ORIENTATION=+
MVSHSSTDKCVPVRIELDKEGDAGGRAPTDTSPTTSLSALVLVLAPDPSISLTTLADPSTSLTKLVLVLAPDPSTSARSSTRAVFWPCILLSSAFVGNLALPAGRSTFSNMARDTLTISPAEPISLIDWSSKTSMRRLDDLSGVMLLTRHPNSSTSGAALRLPFLLIA